MQKSTTHTPWVMVVSPRPELCAQLTIRGPVTANVLFLATGKAAEDIDNTCDELTAEIRRIDPLIPLDFGEVRSNLPRFQLWD